MSEEKRPMVRVVSETCGRNNLKISAFRMRDPETGQESELQFHMVYSGVVLAVMDQYSASIFSDFVQRNLPLQPHPDADPQEIRQ